MEATHSYRPAASQTPLSTQQGCNPWQADCRKSSASLPSRLLSSCCLCPLSAVTSVQLWTSLPFSLPFSIPYSTIHCISSALLKDSADVCRHIPATWSHRSAVFPSLFHFGSQQGFTIFLHSVNKNEAINFLPLHYI